jgi:exodeoxyribonuclease V
MYRPITNEHGLITTWQRKRDLYSDSTMRPITRIIIDEASMVGRKLADDLLMYGLPIFAVGDHGQLPPVQDESIFDSPKVQLTKIHRHAENNPILKLSQLVRENGDLPPLHQLPDAIRVVPNADVMEIVGESYERLGMDMAVLVRRNLIRKNFNILPRESPEPEIGDIVICLRNNPPIYNGMRGTIKAIEPYMFHWYQAQVFFPDDGLTVEGLINRYQFGREATIEHVRDLSKPNNRYQQSLPLGMLFDFGLAMTVHKAQGSAFQEVILCPEKWSSDYNSDDYCKWLYTAVTRAVNKLTIVR